MTGPGALTLSKSRFMAGLQCLKRLYLETYARHLADPRDPGSQAVLDSGTRVGELARQRFPGGVLIGEQYDQHAQAVESTAKAMQYGSIPSLYEAAFTFEGIRTRVDVLVRNDDGAYDLVEVKSSTSAKAEHISDAAIQLYVLEGAGLAVSRAFVMHIDSSYVYGRRPLRPGLALPIAGRHGPGPLLRSIAARPPQSYVGDPCAVRRTSH